MKIGDRIRDRRMELGFSQDELAKRLGYKSRSSINKIERDASGLPQTKIEAIANALDTTPGYIMGWEEKPAPKLGVKEKAQKAISQISPRIPKKMEIRKVFSFGSKARKGLEKLRPAYVGLTKNGTARVALPQNTSSQIKIAQPATNPSLGEFETELMRIYAGLDVKRKLALLAKAHELALEKDNPMEKTN